MRNRRNGRIASTFARKGLLRSDLPHQRLVTRALHQKRLVALQERAWELAALGTTITSKELYAATPLYRSGKARQLISSAIKHRSKLQVLQAAAHRRSGKKQTQYTSSAEAMSATEGYVGRQFVESLSVTAAAAPLFFQNRTKTIVKTEATIERERLANIASKELRYKITAQYAEGLTSFIPSLISQMISRRTKTQKLTRRNVKRIVSSTY
jgi:ElaB/YqjD/DUF883 family membrane-anchored ribosome-binding protein